MLRLNYTKILKRYNRINAQNIKQPTETFQRTFLVTGSYNIRLSMYVVLLINVLNLSLLTIDSCQGLNILNP